MYTLAVGRWKYVHQPASGEHALYDLERDPGELVNRIDEEAGKAAEIRELLLSLGAVTGGGVSLEGIDPERLEAMRALGYLGPEGGGK